MEFSFFIILDELSTSIILTTDQNEYFFYERFTSCLPLKTLDQNPKMVFGFNSMISKYKIFYLR